MTHIKLEPGTPGLNTSRPASSVPAAPETSLSLSSLQALSQETNVDKLEKALEEGSKLLESIKNVFASAQEAPEIKTWIQSIEKLQAQFKLSRAVVGVVGTTGSGKSSVINAVLDEECLVPTNCMRACTAVITEIAYNTTADENSRYRADIHFITKEEWETELKVMLDDLAQANGQIGTEETETGIAHAKVRSVYPDLDQMSLLSGKYTAQGLANRPDSKGVLGNVVQISASDVEKFQVQLRPYIDSQDNSKTMEYWPLIKVVKIFVKSAMLESGLVLVDLPGAQDNNAARSTVSAKYLEECTRLWVVAPINRAVNDKTAHDLMGRAFRRQLQLDTKLASVSFICSKTDDIQAAELLRGAPEDSEPQQLQLQLKAAEKKLEQLEGELDPLHESISLMSEAGKKCDNESAALNAAIRKATKEGGLVSITPQPAKRKAHAPNSKPRKRRLRSTLVDSDDDSSEEEDNPDVASAEVVSKTMSIADARSQLQDLYSEKDTLWGKARDAENQVKPLKAEIRKAKKDVKRLKNEVKAACVLYRNNYARPTIQAHFADGIKELDQEAAARRDEDNFDPYHLERDYNELAASLPVFCVSSRAYQKLCGRLDQDEALLGFGTIETTEVPALRQHGIDLVHEIRLAVGQSFTKVLAQMLTSLYLQFVDSAQPVPMSDQERTEESRFLKESTKELQAKIDLEISSTFKKIRNEILRRLNKNVSTSAMVASAKSIDTVAKWGRPKDDGGYIFATYRAICARRGEFKRSAVITQSFNQDLADPMLGHVSGIWEQTFSHSIPEAISALADVLYGQVDAYSVRLRKRTALRKARRFSVVTQQIEKYGSQLKDVEFALQQISTGQQGANRQFVRMICQGMLPAYRNCAAEKGTGCFKRMKLHMEAYAEERRDAIFNGVKDQIRDSLNKAVDLPRQHLEAKAAEIVENIKLDSESLVASKSGLQAFCGIADKIHDVLHDVDVPFQKILGVSVPASTPVAAVEVVQAVPGNPVVDAIPTIEEETINAVTAPTTESSDAGITATVELNGGVLSPAATPAAVDTSSTADNIITSVESDDNIGGTQGDILMGELYVVSHHDLIRRDKPRSSMHLFGSQF
ncbi:Dynamin family-domain-containing protein [Podospora fimiseda]|uniref:Dynamin family-domain-containing protein n=1 Tax=Podospora fimiseda TaxID=252190 RepID=A0AAN7BYS9_9PEZI|nr:Dynamin family-domain-containing protein [Podospora fimiseda]